MLKLFFVLITFFTLFCGAATADRITDPLLTDLERGVVELHECPICLTDMAADLEEIVEVFCIETVPHAFHKRCLEEWIYKHNSCPLCRRDLVEYTTDSYTVVRRFADSSGRIVSLKENNLWRHKVRPCDCSGCSWERCFFILIITGLSGAAYSFVS